MSTGEGDKELARVKAMSLLAPVLTSRDADMLESAAFAVRRLRGQAAKEVANRILLADCWKLSPQNVSSTGRALKEGTLRNYRYTWDAFVRFASGQGVVYAGDVGEALIEKYFSDLGPRSRTICFDLGKRIFERLGIVPSPWSKKPSRSGSVTHREPLDMEQIKVLLDRVDALAAQKIPANNAEEFAVFVRFLLYTGLRLGDAATFPSRSFNRESGILQRRTAKTGRVVSFPIHPDLMERLTRGGFVNEEYLFPSLAAQYFKRKEVLSKRFRRLFDSVEISGSPHQYCAHALRTTFASICAGRGVPLPVIQSWLGHDCPSVTRIYARVEDIRQKRLALAKFPTLGKEP